MDFHRLSMAIRVVDLNHLNLYRPVYLLTSQNGMTSGYTDPYLLYHWSDLGVNAWFISLT